jgi:hypothetical protein
MGNRARDLVSGLRGMGRKVGLGLGGTAVLSVALAATLGLGGCNGFTQFLSRGAAYKPKSAKKVDLAWDQMRLFAGDMNFHYAPPDDVSEVRRDQKASMELLDKSDLDFVIVTPKLKARFWENPGEMERAYREWQVASQTFNAMGEGHPLLILGAEYFDEQWGSASLIAPEFASILGELQKLSRDQLKTLPGLLFEYVKLQRGLTILNTPLATPLKVPLDSPLRYARTDRSWRGFNKGIKLADMPKDIQWLHANYNGMEAYSVPVSIWRDKYVLDDPLASVKKVLEMVDKNSLQLNRRLLATAGTDSRGRLVRSTLFVAAQDRSKEKILEGLRAGRICLRSPTACTVRMYINGGTGVAMHVGGSVSGARTVEFSWPGEGQLYRNGELVDTFVDRTRTLPAQLGVCEIYRVHVDEGYSGAFYVNCDLMQQ